MHAVTNLTQQSEESDVDGQVLAEEIDVEMLTENEAPITAEVEPLPTLTTRKPNAPVESDVFRPVVASEPAPIAQETPHSRVEGLPSFSSTVQSPNKNPLLTTSAPVLTSGQVLVNSGFQSVQNLSSNTWPVLPVNQQVAPLQGSSTVQLIQPPSLASDNFGVTNTGGYHLVQTAPGTLQVVPVQQNFIQSLPVAGGNSLPLLPSFQPPSVGVLNSNSQLQLGGHSLANSGTFSILSNGVLQPLVTNQSPVQPTLSSQLFQCLNQNGELVTVTPLFQVPQNSLHTIHCTSLQLLHSAATSAGLRQHAARSVRADCRCQSCDRLCYCLSKCAIGRQRISTVCDRCSVERLEVGLGGTNQCCLNSLKHKIKVLLLLGLLLFPVLVVADSAHSMTIMRLNIFVLAYQSSIPVIILFPFKHVIGSVARTLQFCYRVLSRMLVDNI